MANSNKLKRISAEELDALLDRANAEQWQKLILLGPGIELSGNVDDWPAGCRVARDVFQLVDYVEGLAHRVGHLTHLTSLDLLGNRIGDDGAKAIANLANLTSLNLRYNGIGEDGAKAIANLANLTSLDLSVNGIGEGGTEAIGDLAKLSSLSLSGNGIGDDGAKALTTLPKLTSLNLRANRIGDDGAKAITALANLTSLNLSENRIGNDGAKAIANLANLTSLNLGSNSIQWSNRIGVDGAKAIASLAKLTSLNLSENSIGDDGAKAIANLANLTSLRLGSNSIGVDGAKAIASLANLTSLILWNNSIGNDGAKAIAYLEKLTSLNLSHNSISVGGAEAIASLANLTSLDLGGNRIGDDGTKAIASLANLTSLDLRSNSIGVGGAEAIASLAKLTSLDLSHNRIADDGAKAIASLANLTSLVLAYNSIGIDGARAIASLANLTSLNLSDNSIGVDGTRAILEAWIDAPAARQIQTLDLRNNEDIGELLPPEVLETSDAQAILAAYWRYRIAEKRPLGEAKLLVVGNEAVGKTSLLRYLIEGKARDPSEKKTPGIATHEKIETRTWPPDSQTKRSDTALNVWDFGGQEMMRGTHRFFLTERSLYLLVLEDRRQDDEAAAEAWLKTILNRGGDSPIIMIINKSDQGKQDLRLNETGLRRSYPNIVDIVRTSCEPDDWADASITALRTLIAATVGEHPQLKHVRDPVPESWLRIKQAVAEMAQDSSVLSLGQFERLCEQEGEQGEAISKKAEQRALLRLLHDLGTVVAHGLERDAPAAIREITLLDPNWLTGAIYTLLNEPQVRDQDGEFERGQMALWLDPTTYPPERHEFVLEMMQNPDIGLCFRLPDPAGERYLIPETLPANEPDYSNWQPDSLCFRYTYGFLPRGLIPRFIVQAHRNLTKKKTRWRTGVVLSAADCHVLVRGDLDQRQIDIAVDGPPGMRRAALNIVLNDLDFVHALNPECEPEARVPLPGRPEKDVGYDYLRQLEDRYGLEHRFLPEGEDREYSVEELLEGVRRERTHIAPSPRDWRTRHPQVINTINVGGGDQNAAPKPEPKKPHWVVEHAVKVFIGAIVLAVVGWVGANHELLLETARCTFSADGCPPSGDGERP